jgi:hypothetical protein
VPTEVASGRAPSMVAQERVDILPESNLEVVVRSPEIQDAELIHSAPMSWAARSSRGRIELLAQFWRQAEQWMKVSCRYP